MKLFCGKTKGAMKILENTLVQSVLFLSGATAVIAFVIYADCRWGILWDVACYWWKESPIF